LAELQSNGQPIYRQTYEMLRQAILSGQLAPGTRLPSTVAVAEALGVARGTIQLAYEMLVSEGYLTGVAGSGTYVADDLPEQHTASQPFLGDVASSSRQAGTLSRRGRSMLPERSSTPVPVGSLKRPFHTGDFTAPTFPFEVWSRIATRLYRRGDRAWLENPDAAGYLPLREVLAEYLRTARAVECTARQVVIFNGSTSAITFITEVLTDPGDAVWIEDPCWPDTEEGFLGGSTEAIPVPVDGEGLNVAAGVAARPDARLAYVVPSCQVPFNVTMSMARRLALLQWARDHGAWILEHDNYGEFRYRGRPLPSLQGLDRAGRTIYLGDFNRTLFPSIRLAYAVVPEVLVDDFVRARDSFDLYTPVFDQIVAAEFIAGGHFLSHIRRMRRYQAECQRVVVEAAAVELAGLLDIQPQESGSFLVGWLADGIDDEEASVVAARFGVSVDPLRRYYYRLPPDYRPGLVLGYTGHGLEELRDGVRRLAGGLRTLA
jgi:GntR family transcriptional regulator/MocR family aminotransferase